MCVIIAWVILDDLVNLIEIKVIYLIQGDLRLGKVFIMYYIKIIQWVFSEYLQISYLEMRGGVYNVKCMRFGDRFVCNFCEFQIIFFERRIMIFIL